ncbi:mechanosensitive ion channel domain-containing protein [Consotaella aegiceratis]|uniref:mechanosensitive ion channel domain-containing protein n=1 Tax=Consotaella aegiceratis TaxID=3097961 RepID=UPI002F3FCC64
MMTFSRLWLLFLLLFTAVAAPAAAQILSLPTAASSGESQDEATSQDAASLDDLIGILENDEARAKLIDSLKAAASNEEPAANAESEGEGDSPPSELVQSLPRQIAAYSRNVVELGVGVAENLWGTLNRSFSLMTGVSSLDLPRLTAAILPVVLVMVVVFAVLGLTRLIKTPIFARMADRASHSGPLGKLSLLVISSLIDAVTIVLGWAGGHIAAAIYNGGAPNINQTLFLNAFLAIEGVKVVLSMLMAPRYPQLRLTPFGDRQASYWYFWLSRLISILGYTFLFLAPIVQANSSFAAARAVRVIVSLACTILEIWLVLQNRVWVRDRLGRSFEAGNHSFRARFLWLLGRVWWLIAIVYVVSLFSAWLTSPHSGLQYLAAASIKTLIAMAVGGLVTSVLTWLTERGIKVPQSTKERLPLLERRVNSFIPALLTAVRVLVVVVVIAVIFEAWQILDFSGWIATSVGQRFVGGLLGAGIVLIISFGIYLVVSSWVEYRLNPNFGSVPTARERTLLALFRNGFTITLVVIVAMLVLSQVGIDIGPLLAGAGVVGLAVGFGSQKLVQDIITGAFIQLENAMNEGDVVEVGGVSGVVERLTIRSVALRALDGTYHLIPFSSVDQVANMTKDFSQFVIDLGVAYREDTEEVKTVMHEAFETLRNSDHGPEILGDFEMFGVNELGDSAVVVRGRIKTLPGKQWGVGRAYNEVVKRLCDERGIEIPFPHMTVWFGEGKDGTAPPMRLQRTPRDERATVVEGEARAALPDESSRPEPTLHGSIDAEGKPIPPDHDDVDDR